MLKALVRSILMPHALGLSARLLMTSRQAWTTVSPPQGTATPTCRGEKKSRAFPAILVAAHFPVMRLMTSPIAIGLMPPAFFESAIRFAPEIHGRAVAQASPRLIRLHVL